MDTVLKVSEFVALTNQILESAFPFVKIEGEVSNFKISQNKWVTFKLTDGESIVECFMTVWNMRTPLEDGMTVVVAGNPALKGKWGKFSVTAQRVVPIGEGALQRAFELLRKKLKKEGLFEQSRKRPIPQYPSLVGVISSEQADGYKDFITIASQRWPLADILFAHSTVQGESAPDSLIAALDKLNQHPNPPDVIAMVRGGGSAEDLSAFNDERLVRAIAGSRIPVVVGVGHENDTTLADLVCDRRAATPTHAAETMLPDARAIKEELKFLRQSVDNIAVNARQLVRDIQLELQTSVEHVVNQARHDAQLFERIVAEINPKRQLARGYVIARKSGSPITSIIKLKEDDRVELEFKDGKAISQIKETK